jgi:hypothetical protein
MVTAPEPQVTVFGPDAPHSGHFFIIAGGNPTVKKRSEENRKAVSLYPAMICPSSSGDRVLVANSCHFDGGSFVSIVRVGLAETKHFAEGYDAIFGNKKGKQAKKSEATAKSGTAKKKKKAKKK